MSTKSEIRQTLTEYFQRKVEKYYEKSLQEVTEKLSLSDAGERAVNQAVKWGGDENVEKLGSRVGCVAGGLIGGLVGLPEFVIGAAITLPLGALVGSAIGSVTFMGAAAGAGAGVSVLKSTIQRGTEEYQQNQIDDARVLSPELANNLNDLVENLLNNPKIFNKLRDLNSRGKTKRIEDICKDYYKIVKQQILEGDLDITRALNKLKNKSSVRGSALSRLSMFASSKVQACLAGNEESCNEISTNSLV